MLMGKRVGEMKIGDKAFVEKTISESDVYLFSGITGDLNPVHVNQRQAQETRFKGRIAHGILVTGLISTCIGMHLPGPGAIYLGQQIKFTAPVYIGDTVSAEVEIIELNAEKNRVKLKTTCTNQEGKVVISGEALVMPPV